MNPPPGSNFYPIYTTGTSTQTPSGHCVWQFGGPFIKGTTNTFGGNSAAEFGPLLFSFYPNPNPAIRLRTNNFRNVLSSNPCRPSRRHHDLDRRAPPRGALRLVRQGRGTWTRRTFDQSCGHGFGVKQSRPITVPDTCTKYVPGARMWLVRAR